MIDVCRMREITTAAYRPKVDTITYDASRASPLLNHSPKRMAMNNAPFRALYRRAPR